MATSVFHVTTLFSQGQFYSAVVTSGAVEPQFKVVSWMPQQNLLDIPKLNLIQGNRNDTPKTHFLSEKLPPVRKVQVGSSFSDAG